MIDLNCYFCAALKIRLLLIFIAVDVLVMTVFFGGKRNETISACLWSIEKDGKWYGSPLRKLVDWLLSWAEKDHCRKAWVYEQRQITFSEKNNARESN